MVASRLDVPSQSTCCLLDGQVKNRWWRMVAGYYDELWKFHFLIFMHSHTTTTAISRRSVRRAVVIGFSARGWLVNRILKIISVSVCVQVCKVFCRCGSSDSFYSIFLARRCAIHHTTYLCNCVWWDWNIYVREDTFSLSAENLFVLVRPVFVGFQTDIEW